MLQFKVELLFLLPPTNFFRSLLELSRADETRLSELRLPA